MLKFNKVSALVLTLGAVAGSAMAELPTAATAAMTAVEADGSAMLDAGWPIAVTIVSGMILFKLFKKVTNKAT